MTHRAEGNKLMVSQDIWLHYFNQILFERDIITEEQRNHMCHHIQQRSRDQRRRK